MSLLLTRQKSKEDRLARAASGEGRVAGGCRCLTAAKSWLASSANTLHLKLHKATEDEWIIACPSLSADSDSGLVSFAVTLMLPHGLAVADDGSILEELEAESYDCLFSEDESSHKKRQQLEAVAVAATAPVAKASMSDMSDDPSSDSLPPPGPASSKHEGCTVSAILSFAHEFIVKMDSGFGSPAATSAASASARPATAKSPPKKRSADDDDGFGDDDGAEGGDTFDDAAGFSDDGGGGDDDDGGDWGTTEEVDLLDAGVDASAKTMAGTPSPAHARLAVGFSAASVNADNGGAASSSAPTDGGVHVYSKDDIASMQAVMIPRVASNLCITTSAAILMLRKARWDENACIAKYKADPSGFAKEAGCLGLLREYMAPAPAHGPDELFTCGVCYDDEVPWDRTFAMKCQHRFCLGCWAHYLESEIKAGSITGGNALGTKCAGEKCKEGLGQECVELILAYHDSPEEEAAHKELLGRYENMLRLSFVDENSHLQWCPAPGCEKVVQSYAKLNTVKCSCGFCFCFICKLEAHAPATCKEAAEWTLRDKAEANLDTKFLMEQTKPCPKCHVRTKKEGGCMYIVCTQCKCSWCWHCGQDGTDHHVWECNRPSYEGVDKESEINKYLFYYERYFNHKESKRVAGKQLAATEEKMSKLVSEGMHFMQVEFLKSATQLVLQCRRVLSWSYAHAFYITDKGVKTLFEFRQSELEQYTEKLNQLTEGSLEQLHRDRLLVLDWTRALGRYLQNMEIDETHVEKAIPAGAHVTKIKKDDSASSSSAAAGTPEEVAAAAAKEKAEKDKGKVVEPAAKKKVGAK